MALTKTPICDFNLAAFDFKLKSHIGVFVNAMKK